MKILLVNKFHYMKGGSETYYFSLANLLKSKGHEVIFFALSDKKNIECEQDNYFIDNVDYNKKTSLFNNIKMIKNMNYSKESYDKMKKLLNDQKPNLVVLNLVHRQITLSIIDAIKDYDNDLPIFWIMHDLICACPRATMLNGKYEICNKCYNGKFSNCFKNKCIKNSFIKSFIASKEAYFIKRKKLYDKVDIYISPSECHTQLLLESKFTKKTILHMKNFLPFDFKYNDSCVSEDYVLFFARLAKDKGIYTTIKAFEKLDKNLYIVGKGEEENNIKKYLKDNNLKNIEMLGYKSGDELKQLVIHSKCIILASEWYENCPYSIMESMAYSKPIIASNIGGLPEMVIDKFNGYLVEPRDSKSIIEAVKKLYNLDNDAYKQMCNNSYELAKNLFDSEKYYKKLMELYECVKGEKNENN